ncbi:helicase-exonuclease AddAB subunit AddB [Peptococcaceae bacterium 1198_IL3148]
MSLRFILGRAGSGKTTCCLQQIRQQLQAAPTGNNLILLVPEQATFHNELELASTPQLGGMMRAQVLSFNRLTWRVLQEVGGGARVQIADLGKRMILRQFLEQRQEQLRVFGGAADQPGFVDSLASAISEMKMYQVKVADLKQALDQTADEESLLLAKLRDLVLIYQDLEDYLANTYTDPDDYLNLLAEKAHLSPTIQHAEIWLDGFTGFTPQELTVIEALLQTARRVNITLTLPPQRQLQQDAGCFNITWTTYNKLLQLAEKLGIEVEAPLLLEQPIPHRFVGAADIAHLEQSYFDLTATAYPDKAEHLKIIGAQNFRAEVEAVAREIRSLCRDQGYRYRDMAVLLRDYAHYDLLIETIFSDYNIPIFMDRKRTVMHHPLVELVRSALEAVQEGWLYEPVFRYLKTDLVNAEREEIDILENFVLAYGIKGSAWYRDKPWQYHKNRHLGTEAELSEREQQQLAQLNRVRRQAVAELAVFHSKIKQATTAAEITQALFELLVDLKVPQKLKQWSEVAEQQGRLETAREHSQIWNEMVDIFDQMVATMGEETLNLESYSKILDAGLEGLSIGLIPPGLDQVVIGSLERSRNPNLKAVFVVGVGDGILPAKPMASGIFNDQERQSLKELGLELAADTTSKLLDEQFLIYTALTRASDYLCLSYPLGDSEGKALRPSVVIKRVKELFPQLQQENISVEPQGDGQDINFINSPAKALMYLGKQLRLAKETQKVDAIWWDVYNWLLQHERYKPQLARVVNGLLHQNQLQPIDGQLAKKLFGTPLRASVSRLEKFQSCPFAHFVNYGLRLREREIYKLSTPDLGQFFHAAMEQFAKKLQAMDLDWAQLDKQQCLQISDDIVAELAPQLQSEILLSSGRYRYLTGRFKKTVQRAATMLVEHARRGMFRPVGLEIAFGPEQELPGLKITLSDGTEMELIGRIDRVDGCEKDNQYYLRVIDYKSGSTDLKLDEVFYGFKIQLITYLDIILRYAGSLVGREDCQPAGILYFYLRDPLINTAGPLDESEIEAMIIKELRMKGLVLADLAVFQLMDGETQSGWSTIIPVGINAEGKKILQQGDSVDADIDQTTLFYKDSKIALPTQIEALRQHVQRVLAQTGEAIINGEVAISPYELKDHTACDFCPFLMVCQFDTTVEGNSYRSLKPLSSADVWSNLAQGEE